MKSDRVKWNQRYREDMGNPVPSRLVARYYADAPPGNALDIACGNGRNSIFLAEKGFQVDAVDISDVAIARLKAQHPHINALCRDLDQWHIPSRRYGLIINIRFLERRLFSRIETGLTHGGLLIFQSFVGAPGASYCLEKGELRDIFPSLRILHYEEKPTGASGRFKATASLVAQKPRMKKDRGQR